MSAETRSTRFLILMGVASSGKTTVGKALSLRLGWDFYDADVYHPAANIEKMETGMPLTDADRLPWLSSLHDLIASCLKNGRPGVLACSALKQSYRRILVSGNPGVRIVHLRGEYDMILKRMARRSDHYMKPALLRSQFETLEEPADALTLDVSLPVDEIVERIATTLQEPGKFVL